MMEDSLAEDRHSPVPGLVHRYPDRVLMLITTQCASYCRYCTRSRIVGDATQNFNRAEHEAQLDYIRRTPQIRDVLISGGDGLTLAPALLERVLRGLREIPHVEIIRIGSRVPVFLPQRVDDELCAMLARYHPVWMNLHFNHPNEITPEVSRAVDRLTRAGVPLGNQSVLLAGVNDCVHIQRALVHKLVENRIRPYYLYQCDLVEGAGHFRTPVGKGLEIIEGLRGHTSGYAVPTYVVDAPGGGGKIPRDAQLPHQLLRPQGRAAQLRGVHHHLRGARDVRRSTTRRACAYCRNRRPEPGQGGVHALLQGERMWIEPSGFEVTHGRGSHDGHRLQDPSKWVPYGVGAIDGQAVRRAGRSCRCWPRARRWAPTTDQLPAADQPRGRTGRARSLDRAKGSRPRWPTESCCSERWASGRGWVFGRASTVAWRDGVGCGDHGLPQAAVRGWCVAMTAPGPSRVRRRWARGGHAPLDQRPGHRRRSVAPSRGRLDPAERPDVRELPRAAAPVPRSRTG